MNDTAKQYQGTALALYINYFIHGIQTVILAQGVSFFATRWEVEEAAVFGIIATIGIGKIIVMLFSGVLSDFLGRKPFVILGIIGYLIFFGGLFFCTDVNLAYILAMVAGGATSSLDGGTYPALLDMYPKQASVASIVVKGFIAVASAIVPFVVSFLNYRQYSFNWLIIFAFGITVLSLFFMLPKEFPQQQKGASSDDLNQLTAITETKVKPNFGFEGMLCLVFGFLCLGTFYLWQQSVSKFALDVVGMRDVGARGLAMVFSLSTIVGVLITSYMMKKGIKDIAILVYYTFASTIALILAYLFPIAWVLYMASFMLGFFMAGGLLQMGGALLSQFFPARKGLNTSLYNVSFASATYVIPLLTKELLMQQQFDKLLFVAMCFAALTFAVSLLLSLRYQRVFGRNISTVHAK